MGHGECAVGATAGVQVPATALAFASDAFGALDWLLIAWEALCLKDGSDSVR